MDYGRLGRVIRLRRVTLGISQAELANRAGIDRTYVSDVEAGTRNLSLGVTERLADALGVGLIQLLVEAFNAD
jgi:transcriptional regulator with XRE-family HTH domain